MCPYEGTTGYLQKMLVNAERVEVVGIVRGGHNLHVGEAGEVVKRVRRGQDKWQIMLYSKSIARLHLFRCIL